MKILIIRFSSIGDIVLTTPVVRVAKKHLGAQVHYITKAKYKVLLEENPAIDKIYTIEKNVDEVIKELKNENYDYIIDLHNSTRSILLKWKLKKPSFTVNKKNIEKWLMVNFKKKTVIPHIVERYLETLKPLGGKNDGLGLDFYYKTKRNPLEVFGIKKPYIAVSLGANHFTKRIPVSVLQKILSDIPEVAIVLTGGNDVSEDARKLENSLPGQVYNLAGKTTIPQSAAIIDSSMALVTGDTGMMHIAAALKKPVFLLWGSTVPQFGMYPYYGDTEVFNRQYGVDDLKCRPCSKIGFSKCPKGHFDCMMKQDIRKISSELRSFIEKNINYIDVDEN